MTIVTTGILTSMGGKSLLHPTLHHALKVVKTKREKAKTPKAKAKMPKARAKAKTPKAKAKKQKEKGIKVKMRKAKAKGSLKEASNGVWPHPMQGQTHQLLPGYHFLLKKKPKSNGIKTRPKSKRKRTKRQRLRKMHHGGQPAAGSSDHPIKLYPEGAVLIDHVSAANAHQW